MKAIIILGSRSETGQTAQAVDALVEGITQGGGTAERHYLPQRHIERCRQCDEKGWGTCIKQGRCAIDDDFAALVDKMAQSDVIVYATPVYFGDLAESIRAFLDRLRRVCRHETEKLRFAGKHVLGIAVAGGSGGGAPDCTVRLQQFVTVNGMKLLDMVPVRRQNLPLKREILRLTGRWLNTPEAYID